MSVFNDIGRGIARGIAREIARADTNWVIKQVNQQKDVEGSACDFLNDNDIGLTIENTNSFLYSPRKLEIDQAVSDQRKLARENHINSSGITVGQNYGLAELFDGIAPQLVENHWGKEAYLIIDDVRILQEQEKVDVKTIDLPGICKRIGKLFNPNGPDPNGPYADNPAEFYFKSGKDRYPKMRDTERLKVLNWALGYDSDKTTLSEVLASDALDNQ